MLLIQASEANSKPSQAYKMGILAKIVNGLKLMMGGSYEDIKVLIVWILASVIRVIQLI